MATTTYAAQLSCPHDVLGVRYGTACPRSLEINFIDASSGPFRFLTNVLQVDPSSA